ncbi:MAG: low-density lipoprotein receptor class A repeat-containing protein [Candidatus Thermoplasmatota archaeon]|nr:low-density lipoprotein receptor class A repeat-containing protein [Candidatus Thermoplasmatota archaeon]
MKKTLALLLVASLLLAGCTELTANEGEENLKIIVNEEIAIEEIADFVTVDEGETFGITMMYDMDPSMMDGLIEEDEDSNAVITVEMTEAWSADGYYSSMTTGLSEDGNSIRWVQSMTHIGTTIHYEAGYETVGDVCALEDTEEEQASCEMMMDMMSEVTTYTMTTTTTHTEVIAAMAEETADNSDDMDPMAMLQFFSFVECFGVFTPADSVDGLQVFDVAMEGMDDDELTPEMALCLADADDSNSISFEEFKSVDDTDDEDVSTMQTFFDDADANSDEELTADELQGFIDAVDAHYESEDDYYGDYDDMDDMDDSDMMPAISVAFNDAGEIEYLEMGMDEMGDGPTVMKMYVLTDSRVDSLFTDVDAGQSVALPFTLSDSMDDDDWGDDSDYEDYFMCDDGETIPMSWVNDGMDDCAGGEDEMGEGEESSAVYYDGCTNSEDPADSYWECWMEDWKDSDGDIMMSDGYEMEECSQLEDGSGWMCERSSDGGDDLTPEGILEELDSNEDDMLSWEEFWNSWIEEEGSADDNEALSEIFNDSDTDMDELLSVDELENFISGVIDFADEDGGSDYGPTFICGNGEEIPFENVNDGAADCADGADEQQYNSDGSEINWFDCMGDGQVWISQVNDGYEDCQHGDDEMPEMGDGDGHDHGHDHGDDSDEIVMYVTSGMDFDFEGDMSDYKIELATCDSDYDMETGEETTTCTTVMSVAIADAGMDSDIMFHDADSSGTISVGDMIHIGETAVEWDTVRLYSISADAYSDENPMHDAPGFTGLVGMLALLGAAFIRRNE